MSQSSSTYLDARWPEPHRNRIQAIIKKHPDVKALFGPDRRMAYWTVLIVFMQFAIAFLLREQAWYWVMGAAWLVGAVLNHSLFVVIHEATHNLVFRGNVKNKLFGIFANLPGIFPSAIGFRRFHLLHHRYQGELGWDADLSGPMEARLVGNSPLRKALWFLGFAFVEGVTRPIRVGKFQIFERWALLNVAACVAVTAGVLVSMGPMALGYLVASLLFSVGLHPVGGRWIQEHYVTREGQETYSYYGWMNHLAFNVGYHNEHHDFMGISWRNLPRLKAMAPEFYEPLASYRSWTGLLLRFIFDRKLSLHSRYVRPDHDAELQSAEKPALTSELGLPIPS